jgi:hypothetical protein
MARVTRTQRLLEFIRDNGGATYSEIMAWLCQDMGEDWDEREDVTYFDPITKRWVDIGKGTRRRHRGKWATNLYCSYSRGGLLYRFCEKGPDRKWRVVREIKGPFYPSHEPSRADREKAKFHEQAQLARKTSRGWTGHQ